MLTLAYLYHAAGLGGILVPIILAAVIIWLLFCVLPLPPILRTVFAVIVAVALLLMLVGCANLTPAQKSTGKAIFTEALNIAEVGGEAGAGYYGGQIGQQTAASLFGLANKALAGQPITAQTVQSAVSASGAEPVLAKLAATELAKTSLDPKAQALTLNIVGAAVQQVANQ